MRGSGILCFLVLVVPAHLFIICQIACPQYQQPCGMPYNCGGCCNYYPPLPPPRPYPIIYPGPFYPVPYPPVTRPSIVVKPTPKPQGPVTVVVNTSTSTKEWHCPEDNDDEDYRSSLGELVECEFDTDCKTFSVRHKCCYHYILETHICKPAVTA
ncbi:hypothetical protein PPYR_12743 [Photinus pyralis]|uniref:WAP domain-containing protein n=1 Tax=Photinus pyralis TaxID=7054 RepID=A0A5N4A733_PHOPY|nr:uncharacterized protein LOC116179303 isoform X3 [Photinus pyralis]KAB0793123.1 hypothetical protein PPYR_12743 [Photinus pyralis]